MHEVSLVRSLISQAKTIAADNGGGTVTEIHVSIGTLSGVEPMLVASAFDELAATSQLAGAQLRIDCTRLEAICRECNASFTIESYCFRCPECQSPSVQITAGDDFRLLSLSVEEGHKAPMNKVNAT